MKTKRAIGLIVAIIGVMIILFNCGSYYKFTKQTVTNAPTLIMTPFGNSTAVINAEYIDQGKNSCMNFIYSGGTVLVLGIVVFFFPKKIKF